MTDLIYASIILLLLVMLWVALNKRIWHFLSVTLLPNDKRFMNLNSALKAIILQKILADAARYWGYLDSLK